MCFRKYKGTSQDKDKEVFYPTAIRPKMQYATERWTVKNHHKNKTGEVEMRMLC